VKRIPVNTYRLQLTPSFGFDEVRKILPYLKRMGITDLYVSPIFKARSGSTHGYDVTDPTCLNPELGDEAAFASLSQEAKRLGFGWIQDIVPNHMVFCRENPFLMDVLENDADSEYAGLFDIYWDHPDESLRGRILAPFLGRFLGECLDDREIRISYDEHGFFVNYYTLKFPLCIETYGMILETAAQKLVDNQDAMVDRVRFFALSFLLNSMMDDPQERKRKKKTYASYVKKNLWKLCEGSSAVRGALDAALLELNGSEESGRSALEALLQKQVFRLSFWKVSSQEISYRRFFNINELISVRVEDEKVFEKTHSLIFELAKYVFTGIRVDHIDGLYDPLGYLERLSKKLEFTTLYVEKILAENEELPEKWPVDGSTGYDFLNYLNGLYCNGSNVGKISKFYVRFSGLKLGFYELAYTLKRMIIRKNMAGDVDNLARQLKMISTKDVYGSDITMEGLKGALVEIMTFLPVYRTYVTKDDLSDVDRGYFEAAIRQALAKMPDLLYEIRFIERCLLMRDSFHSSLQEEILRFIHRLQQFTGPVTAKGIEDTLMYRYNRLLSLNEVGGFPEKFGVAPEDFHVFVQRRIKRFPHEFNTTSTHDTKRGEDLRARLNFISEFPYEWEQLVKTLHRLNAYRRRKGPFVQIPDRNDEYFLYQILAATLPAEWKSMDDAGWQEYKDRIFEYILKSIREAKHYTEWIKPDEDYESGYLAFLEALLNREYSDVFLVTLEEFAQKMRYYGLLNTLSQSAIKTGMPGVCDVYQGSEWLNLSLVDPDNRREVDFSLLQEAIETMSAESEDIAGWLGKCFFEGEWGKIKQYLLQKAMSFRAGHPELFAKGSYVPLYCEGALKESVVAFMLKYDELCLVVAAGRLFGGLAEFGTFPARFDSKNTMLKIPGPKEREFVDIFNEKKYRSGDDGILLSELFSHLPCSIIFTIDETK